MKTYGADTARLNISVDNAGVVDVILPGAGLARVHAEPRSTARKPSRKPIILQDEIRGLLHSPQIDVCLILKTRRNGGRLGTGVRCLVTTKRAAKHPVAFREKLPMASQGRANSNTTDSRIDNSPSIFSFLSSFVVRRLPRRFRISPRRFDASCFAFGPC